MAESDKTLHCLSMMATRHITNGFLICIIVISQVAFTYAHASMPLLREAHQTVVICSAAGPLEIDWPLGDEDPPEHPLAAECPLCTLGFTITPPMRSLTQSDTAPRIVSYPILATSQQKLAQSSPYPARAPPG